MIVEKWDRQMKRQHKILLTNFYHEAKRTKVKQNPNFYAFDFLS